MLEKFTNDCIPWEGPRAGAEQCKEEGVEDKESTSVLLRDWRGEDGRLRSEAGPGKKGGVREKVV